MAVEDLVGAEYDAGFISEVDAETIPAGLDESVVRFISNKKSEPEWLTEWRLKAFEAWQAMAEANRGHAPAYGDDQWTTQASDLLRDAHRAALLGDRAAR